MESLNVLNKDTIKLLNSNNLLLPLIKSELIKYTIKKIQLSVKEKENIKSLIISKNKLSNEDEYQEWINKQSLTESELFDKISEQSRINKHCKIEFGHIVERKFLERKDDLEEVTYSLIRVKDHFLANELFLRVNEKEAGFGEIASEFSLGPEKDTKGIVGPISLTKSHPAVTEVLKSSKIGAVNNPIFVNDVWLILRLESFNKSILNEDMELKMSHELFNDWLNEEVNKELNKLTKKIESFSSI